MDSFQSEGGGRAKDPLAVTRLRLCEERCAWNGAWAKRTVDPLCEWGGMEGSPRFFKATGTCFLLDFRFRKTSGRGMLLDGDGSSLQCLQRPCLGF